MRKNQKWNYHGHSERTSCGMNNIKQTTTLKVKQSIKRWSYKHHVYSVSLRCPGEVGVGNILVLCVYVTQATREGEGSGRVQG